jgi:hypothetical protein
MRRLTLLILLLVLSVNAPGCKRKSISLSNDELRILKEIGFDVEMAKYAERYLADSFYQFQTSNPGYIVKDGKQQKTGIKKQNGISWKVGSESIDPVIKALKTDLKEKGYLIFVSEQGYGKSPSEMTIIKSTDQFDILRIQNTDGINYDLENADVIRRLEEWNN